MSAINHYIVFPEINSDVFDIEMMELGGLPLFYHSVLNLQRSYPNDNIIVKARSQIVKDLCNGHNVSVTDGCVSSGNAYNAYQPFLLSAKRYQILEQYKDLRVVDMQSYLFARYILERVEQYDKSTAEKRIKADAIFQRPTDDCGICLIGDSLIEYWGIQKISGHKVFNAGIGDITTDECYEWVVSKLSLSSFKCIFLLVGTNDLKYKTPINLIVTNLNRIVKYIRLQAPDVQLIVSLVPNVHRRWDRRNDDIDRLNAALQSALSQKVILQDLSFLNNAYGELDIQNTIDGLHFLENGYKLLLERLASHIK